MPRFSEETIEEVRRANDIVDVVSQYVALKRSGRNYFGLCPFHNEKSPSFSVSPDKQIFHCFGCGTGGNVFSFLTKIEGISFIEAVQMLADKAGITLPTLDGKYDESKEKLKKQIYEINKYVANYYHENLYNPKSKIAQEYVKKRKLSNETLKAFQIGFSGNFDETYQKLKKEGYEEGAILESGLVNKNDKGMYINRYRNRLMFPICDVRGRVIAFGGRVLDDSKPKYINSPENIVYSKSRNLFGLNVAKKHDIKKLLIVEGYMDVISLHQRGITNVVAPLGTALTQQQGWLLRRSTEQIILGFDSDGAGQTAIERSIEILKKMDCDMRILQMDGAKDPDEYIIKFGELRFKNLMNNAISEIEYKVKRIKTELNLENANDKIKFLKEIAKTISQVNSSIEREVYIEKIANEYNISKEAIYAEINKLMYSQNKGQKVLERTKKTVDSKDTKTIFITKSLEKRESTIISILLAGDTKINEIIMKNIKIDDYRVDINKQLAKKLYEEFEKGNSNINAIIDKLKEEEQNYATMLMTEKFEIDNKGKAIEDILNLYKKEKLESRKQEILKLLEKNEKIKEKKELEEELKDIIIKLVKFK